MPLSEVLADDGRQLQDIADILAASHKIVLITGAGISTSAGIPDFRSKDGLYNLIPERSLLTPPPSNPSTPSKKRKRDVSDDEDEDDLPSSQMSASSSSSRRSSAATGGKLRGQDLFDARVFQNAESTTMHYQFIASLRQKIQDEVKDTSATHKFVRTLRDGGRLMRCYTQNIDGLEAREGLSCDLTRGRGNKRRFMKKHYEAPRPQDIRGTDFDGGCEVVQLHGDLDRLRCNVCATQYLWTDDETEIFLDGFAPNCEKCSTKSEERLATGKRGLAVGSLRPNIVLYGEDHPSNTLLAPFVPFDASCQPDVLIIMGTSLKVFGLQKIVREFAKAVHAQKNGKGKVLFVNRTRPAESVWDGIIDHFVSMDCDDWIRDLKTRRPDLWMRQGEIDATITKPASVKRKRKSENADSEIEKPSKKKSRIEIAIPAPTSELATFEHASEQHNTTKSSLFSTPRHPKSRPLNKHLKGDYPGRKILSPLARGKRPQPSPLSNSFKPVFVEGEDGPALPGSPLTPAMSPITPALISSSKKQLTYEDDGNEPEIEESENDKENPMDDNKRRRSRLMNLDRTDESDMDSTPSRGPGGRKMKATLSKPLVENKNRPGRLFGVAMLSRLGGVS